MKTNLKVIISAAFLIIFHSSLLAQETDSLKNTTIEDTTKYKIHELPEIFSTDNNLILIASFLPQNWYATLVEDTLTFSNISPIYKLTDSIMVDTVRKGRGKIKELTTQKRDSVRITFLLQPLWSGTKVEDAKFQNSHTNGMIDKLPKKYKISHLMDFIQSEEFDINSPTLSENEKKSISRYLEEKEKLQLQLIITPNYHTTDFSLFIIEVYPTQNDRHLFIPPGIVSEIDTIIDLFDKYAGK